MCIPGFFAVALLLLPHLGWSTDNQSVDQIIERTLARESELQKLRSQFVLDFELTTEHLDSRDRVVKTDQIRGKLLPDRDGSTIFELDESILREQPEANREELEKRGRHAKRFVESINLTRLANRFVPVLRGVELVGDRPCYVVDFHPKKDQPFSSREEKVINHLVGTVWITQDDYSILRTQGYLSQPVPVAWIFATVSRADFEFSATTATPGAVPMPESFDLFLMIDLPLLEIRQKMHTRMKHHRVASDHSINSSSRTP